MSPKPLGVPEWLEARGRFLFAREQHIGNVSLEKAASLGVNVICGATNAGYVGLAGGPYNWDGRDRIYNMWTGERIDPGDIRSSVQQAHALGIKVIGELMRMWHPQLLYIEHPEWQELSSPEAKPDGPEHVKNWPPVTGCWNSPFGDFYIRQCVEFIKQFDWDGYNLDGWGCWTTCYCRSCRESYLQETGNDIPYQRREGSIEPGMHAVPPIEQIGDPEFRREIKWRLNRYVQFVDRWQKALKEIKPDFAAMPWSTGPGRWWEWTFAPMAEGPGAANRLVDAPLVELFWDFPPNQGANLLPAFTVLYYRGLTAERPVFMLPYFCTQGQQPMVAPAVETDFRVLTVLTNGARVALSSHQRSRENPDGEVSRHLNLIKEREPWTTSTTSLKWAAMLVSESSRLFYGLPQHYSEVAPGRWIGSGVDSPDISGTAAHDRRLPAHMESALGIFRATSEEHLPIDIITDQDIEEGERLNKYRVLILPNAACLSQGELNQIKAFVSAGGGLLAMQESSLYDEFGTRRPDFGLAELFDASFREIEDHTALWPNYPDSTNIALASHFITDDPVVRGNYRVEMTTLDFIGWTVRVKEGLRGEAIGRRGKDLNASNAINAGPNAKIESKPFRGADPFLVVSSYGKGRVAYYAADVGQSYFVSPYQYQRKLLANAILWVAGEGPSITVTAPMCVRTAFYEQNGGKKQIVHLLNELNTSADRALPESNSSMREEVVPIQGIKVLFKTNKISKARQEPEHLDLTIKEVDGGLEVVVPRLSLHSMVVAEV